MHKVCKSPQNHMDWALEQTYEALFGQIRRLATINKVRGSAEDEAIICWRVWKFEQGSHAGVDSEKTCEILTGHSFHR